MDREWLYCGRASSAFIVSTEDACGQLGGLFAVALMGKDSYMVNKTDLDPQAVNIAVACRYSDNDENDDLVCATVYFEGGGEFVGNMPMEAVNSITDLVDAQEDKDGDRMRLFSPGIGIIRPGRVVRVEIGEYRPQELILLD